MSPRNRVLIAGLFAAGALCAVPAQASRVNWSVSIGAPMVSTVVSNGGYYAAAPVYYAAPPQPVVVYQPAPVVYAPRPVIYQQPVYVQPAWRPAPRGWGRHGHDGHGQQHHHGRW